MLPHMVVLPHVVVLLQDLLRAGPWQSQRTAGKGITDVCSGPWVWEKVEGLKGGPCMYDLLTLLVRWGESGLTSESQLSAHVSVMDPSTAPD